MAAVPKGAAFFIFCIKNSWQSRYKNDSILSKNKFKYKSLKKLRS